MTVYKYRQVLSTNGGTVSANTHAIPGGLCRQFFIQAGTTTTTFRATLTDGDSDIVRQYDYHREEINDRAVLPVAGQYTVQITNASADGQFTVGMLVQE